jgi:hypothetical protein
MPDPTQQGDPAAAADLAKFRAAQDLAKFRATQTGPTDEQLGVAPSYAQKALGGIASFGRYIAPDAQAAARALTRYSGTIPEYLQELGKTKLSDVFPSVPDKATDVRSLLSTALRSSPLGIPMMAADAMKRTPSYQSAQSDIDQGEASSGNVGRFNSGVGAAVGLAPLAGPIRGAVTGGLAPLAAKVRGSLPGKMAEGAWQGFSKAIGEAPSATATPNASAAAPATAEAAANPGGLSEGSIAAMRKAGVPEEVIARSGSGFLPNKAPPSVADVIKQAPGAGVSDALTPEAKAAWQQNAVRTLMPHRPVQLGPDVPPESPTTVTLRDLLDKVNQKIPASERVGNTMGDADIAQQPDIPPSNLEALLRESLTMGKRTPAVGMSRGASLGRP